MPEQTNPHPNWKIILAALLDFATMFAIGGYVIGKLSGQTTENGFSLSGIPALISLALIVAYFVNGLANGIPATLFLYFVSQILQSADMRGPMLFLYFLAGLAGVPAGVKLAGVIGKHRAWCWAMLVNCAIFALVCVAPAPSSQTTVRP